MNERSIWFTTAVALTALLASGCVASRKFVRTEVGASEERNRERIEAAESQIEHTQTELAEHEAASEVQMGELSATAREALERAIAAGKLAEGKFLYEKVLSDDNVRFGFDRTDLTAEAKAELDQFGKELRTRNENVYVEIQGHTDATGSEEYNLKLGERRAESVRRYLNNGQGVPLHRMAVISYGESAPVAGNGTRADRARNRRVVLVVLK